MRVYGGRSVQHEYGKYFRVANKSGVYNAGYTVVSYFSGDNKETYCKEKQKTVK